MHILLVRFMQIVRGVLHLQAVRLLKSGQRFSRQAIGYVPPREKSRLSLREVALPPRPPSPVTTQLGLSPSYQGEPTDPRLCFMCRQPGHCGAGCTPGLGAHGQSSRTSLA